ncbi:MAG: hypothetical protein ACE5J0_03385 [Candidatus Paceibacterales bacterium]
MLKKFLLILVFLGISAFLIVTVTKFLAPSLPPGFVLPSEFVPPERGAIKPFPTVNFTEFEHFSLKKIFGYPVGKLYGLIVIRFILTSVWFVLAVYFLLRYLRGFYGPRMIPLSWLLIVAGLLVTNVAEIGENFVFHEWPYAGILEHIFLFIFPHLWGGLLVATGAWFLLKEIRR